MTKTYDWVPPPLSFTLSFNICRTRLVRKDKNQERWQTFHVGDKYRQTVHKGITVKLSPFFIYTLKKKKHHFYQWVTLVYSKGKKRTTLEFGWSVSKELELIRTLSEYVLSSGLSRFGTYRSIRHHGVSSRLPTASTPSVPSLTTTRKYKSPLEPVDGLATGDLFRLWTWFYFSVYRNVEKRIRQGKRSQRQEPFSKGLTKYRWGG